MGKHKGKAEVNMSEAILTMIKANIMAYVVTAIFVLFSSIILTYTNTSPKFEGIIVIIGVILSSFLAGFDTAKVDDRNGYKWGAIGGAMYFVIFLVLGILIDKINSIAPSMICVMAILVILVSTIAGMVSVNCSK